MKCSSPKPWRTGKPFGCRQMCGLGLTDRPWLEGSRSLHFCPPCLRFQLCGLGSVGARWSLDSRVRLEAPRRCQLSWIVPALPRSPSKGPGSGLWACGDLCQDSRHAVFSPSGQNGTFYPCICYEEALNFYFGIRKFDLSQTADRRCLVLLSSGSSWLGCVCQVLPAPTLFLEFQVPPWSGCRGLAGNR